jgi:sulfatase modifying factor 1
MIYVPRCGNAIRLLATYSLACMFCGVFQPLVFAADKDGVVEGTAAGDVWDGNGIKMEFCWCPPGTFLMGSPKEEPDRPPLSGESQVEVTLTRGFWLAKYELTQSQWKQVTGISLADYRAKAGATLTNPAGLGDDLPLIEVVPADAELFCSKLMAVERKEKRLPKGWEYALPTEAQWEYACRAGTTTATSFGDKLSGKQANFSGDDPYNGAPRVAPLRRPAKVGSYPANAWGLHDMHGNVSEWCCDGAAMRNPGGVDPVAIDPNANKDYAKQYAYRGGSWAAGGAACRSAYRVRDSVPTQFTGFRIALVQTGAGPKPGSKSTTKSSEPIDSGAIQNQLLDSKILFELDAEGQVAAVTIGHAGAPINLTTLKLIGKVKTLKTLRSDAAFDHVSTEELTAIAAIKTLESIQLDSCDFQGSDFKKVATLPKLTKIHLIDSKLDDFGAKGLSTIKTLTVLSLNGNQISDAGLKALSNLKDLEELNVAKNREDRLNPTAATITDAGLAALKGLKHLKTLDLSGCKITDAGLKSLSSLKALETLKLANTKATPEGIAKLQQALTDCKIVTKDESSTAKE